MKKHLFFLCLFLCLSVPVFTWVTGYFRRDGTYIPSHYRSDPDSNPYNNYNYPGNYNPNTGKITKGDEDTYLREYYKPKPFKWWRE